MDLVQCSYFIVPNDTRIIILTPRFFFCEKLTLWSSSSVAKCNGSSIWWELTMVLCKCANSSLVCHIYLSSSFSVSPIFFRTSSQWILNPEIMIFFLIFKTQVECHLFWHLLSNVKTSGRFFQILRPSLKPCTFRLRKWLDPVVVFFSKIKKKLMWSVLSKIWLDLILYLFCEKYLCRKKQK